MAILPNDQLASFLVKNKLVEEKAMAETVAYATGSNIPLEDAVLEKSLLSDEKFGQALAVYFKMPFINLNKVTIPQDVIELIPDRVMRRQKAVAFARDANGVKVAIADPKNLEVLQLVAKKTGQKVLPHLATIADIQSTLRIYQGDLQKIVDNLMAEDIGRTPECWKIRR